MQQGMQERGQLDEIPTVHFPLVFLLNGIINLPNDKQHDHGDPARAAKLPPSAGRHGGHAVGTLQKLMEATQRNAL